MPNHVENDLYIDGPKERVAELLAFIGADKENPSSTSVPSSLIPLNTRSATKTPERWTATP